MNFFGNNDPFFSDMHRTMHRQMQEMDNLMNGMMAGGPMFGNPMFGHNPRDMMMLEGQQGTSAHQQNRQMMDPRQRQPPVFGGQQMMPFGFGGGMFGGGMLGGFGGLANQMDQMRQQAEADPNSHVYSHSTVISYDGTGEQPKYHESTKSLRKAGQAKEIRKTVRDSDKGEDKMSIAHHLGERAHVVEKRRDRSGQMHENQEFVNLDEDEAHGFDREFSHATRQAMGGGHRLEQHRQREDPLAIEHGTTSGHGGRTRRYPDPSVHQGPIIEEVDDELPGESSSKRRKGYLGKIFKA